jgi:hypothetical protein
MAQAKEQIQAETMRERRRAMRVRALLPLRMQARDAEHEARLRDISTAGLCCFFPEPVPEMTLVGIQLELAGKVHDLEGAVVRCMDAGDEGYEVAVFFTNLPGPVRVHLGSLVADRQRGGHGT